MPSQRKRIGFLPRADVQEIINQICKLNKLSQSKVTGILVEEALSYRGVLNRNFIDKTSENATNKFINQSLSIPDFNINDKSIFQKDNINLEEGYITEELEMINDFIEFKFFKNVMNKKKNRK